MARGAAKEGDLGKVHSLITEVFTKVLDKYLRDLDRVNTPPDAEDLSDELQAALSDAMAQEPNPAMLSAITKFLKDNSVSFDDEAVKGLSGLEAALEARRQNRSNVVALTTLKAVGDGT